MRVDEWGPRLTLPQLLDLRAELIERGMDPNELADELENLTTGPDPGGTDTLASFRHELGLQ
jgi:hypothetical protein